MMSDLEDNTFKISVPIITNEELKRFEYSLETDLDNIVNEISTHVSRDREIILLKKVIEKQQKEIEKLKENNGYHLGFIDGGIAKRYEYEDKIKAKVIEIKDRPVKDEFITATQGKLNTIIDIESLLEKE